MENRVVIPPQDIWGTTVELFTPEGKSIGLIHNENQLNHVRIQILQKQLEGYYVIYNSQKIYINHQNGDISAWPFGMFDAKQRAFAEIIRLTHQLQGYSVSSLPRIEL